MLEYNGRECSPDPTYSKDDCVLSWINGALLDEVGCTVPFLPAATQVTKTGVFKFATSKAKCSV